MDFTRGVVFLRRSLADYSNDARHIVITGQRSEDRDQKSVEIGGQGKDSNLRYDLRRIATLSSCCLKPLSHLSSTFLLYRACMVRQFLCSQRLSFASSTGQIDAILIF